MEGKNILIVDDDRDFVRELKEMLDEKGYMVMSAGGASQAITEICKARPDIMVTDIKMDGMNGFQLVDRLTSTGLICDIPVIVMSAYYIPDEFLRVNEALGIKAFIRKPFAPCDLLRYIDYFSGTR